MLKDPVTNGNSPKIAERDRAKLKLVADYSSVESLSNIWPLVAQRFGNTVALQDPHAKPETVLTYAQLYQQIQQFAAGLQAKGIGSGEKDNTNDPPRVALISDNNPRWMIADQGIMMAGAADVVRSSQAEKEELLFILENSGSTALVVEDKKTLKKLGDRIYKLPIKLIILLSDEQPETTKSEKILNFSQVMAAGNSQQLKPVSQDRNTLATLLYTSGTTGKPKGVRLTHGNLMHQLTTLGGVVQPHQGDIALSILPTWHSFGRIAEYFLLSQGCTQVYTNIRYIKQDFKQFQPQYMIGVPRLLEAVYDGVQKKFREQPANKQKLVYTLFDLSQRYIENKRTWQGLRLQVEPPSLSEKLLAGIQAAIFWPLHQIGEQLVYKKVRSEATGGKMKYFISGGGSLAMHLENFFEIVGFQVLVGYGLTETSPVTHARRYWRNLRGSAGQPILGTEAKIVDPETKQPLPLGKRGLVLLRGPQIMQGYYENPQATAKAIDSEGWFDSGDLGWLTAENDLVLTGRAKDTIVLTNGENIEPQPIEDACLRSPYIQQIMLVGQDEKSLGALIVPHIETLKQWAASQGLQLVLPNETFSFAEQQIDLDSKIVQDLYRQELIREVQNRPGYRPDDRIGPFKLISEPFTIENGMLTQTLKIRRPVVMDRYRDMIDGMF